MKHRKIAFYLALYLFITGTLTGCKKTTKEEIIEVIKTTKPTNETISIIEKPEENIIEIEETEPIIEETEPIIEETYPLIEETITNTDLLTLDEIALEVIGGKWGYGQERRDALTKAGYNQKEVSKRVNEIMNGSPYTIPNRNTYNLNFGYVSKDVDVYDQNGNKEGILRAYQKVFVTDTKIDDMVFVHYQNQTFYLKEKDIKKLADSYIEIDISEQKVYMYIDGELVLDADVITGHPEKGTTKGTNLGVTEVYSKSYNVAFTPEKISEYHILFNWDGEAFHDATWREDWEFNDKSRYITNGSDGCTNMKKEDVEILDEYSYLGMPVLTHK